MNEHEITALEQQMMKEHRKDLEALARLKRFLPSNGSTSAPETSKAMPVQPSEAITPLVPDEYTPLKEAIRDIVNNDPSVRWTNPKMLKYLREIGFELKAKKPIYSINQGTKKLIEAGEIKLIRKGYGSTPSVYRGLTPLEQAARESVEDSDLAVD